MPLTAEQTAALQTAADALQGADAKDVADALKAALPDPYQSVYARGFGTSKGEARQQADALQAQIEALTAERDAAKEQADALGSKDADFAAEKKRLEDALVTAKAEKAEALKTASERIKALHASRERAALVADLVAKGVDADYAEQVLAPKLAARIRVGEPGDDGQASVDYLDADGLTPLQTGRGGLADQALKDVDPKWLRSTADGGAGTSTGGSGPAGYDPVAAGKALAAEQKNNGTHAGLALT